MASFENLRIVQIINTSFRKDILSLSKCEAVSLQLFILNMFSHFIYFICICNISDRGSKIVMLKQQKLHKLCAIKGT